MWFFDASNPNDAVSGEQPPSSCNLQDHKERANRHFYFFLCGFLVCLQGFSCATFMFRLFFFFRNICMKWPQNTLEKLLSCRISRIPTLWPSCFAEQSLFAGRLCTRMILPQTCRERPWVGVLAGFRVAVHLGMFRLVGVFL